MKKLLLFIALGVLFLFTACGDDEATGEEKKDLVVGFGVGTYEEQFRASILPILEEQGYDVTVEVFSQNMQLNPAMKEGSIDASVFQSTAYMEGINDELGMEMSPIAYVPGAPQSLHSVKYDSMDEVEDNITVALPNDPVNQERAVRILEDLGWVKVKEGAGTTDFNLNSVELDKYEIEFKVLDPAQILVSLEDVDFGVVNGNYIADAGMKITDALKIEDTPLEHRIIVTTLAEDKDTEWAADLTAAYESVEFEEYILSQEKYDGFILPEAWEDNN
ncbi:MetQ/NlpA family ABC transporter substrate-binding protein [Paraliobacillus sp. JSM ZJ581]|uniref:MetQ/NlpA family ABC transporter substrate-binding protein n=1 Tax=Paraliobacillus sp. JSM ZJ581 TaxID=3342118 RepID=UPI0035A9728B